MTVLGRSTMVILSTLTLTALLTSGCAESGDDPGIGESADSVTVVFTRDERPVPVRRPVPQSSTGLEVALERLLEGPTEEEESRGIGSWFSAETAGALSSVSVDPSGRAVVDLRDLRPFIPGASSSTGSTLLLQELNGTVFQFPEIRSVEYRMEGSCELFWEWLQYGCQIVTRPEG